MTAIIQTVDTPDGPFTILADAEQRVLASGWTESVEAIRARLGSRHPLALIEGRGVVGRGVEEQGIAGRIVEGETDAASAVRAYYGGDLSAIDDVAVAQTGTELQLAGWAMLRRIRPGEPLTYTQFADRLGNPRAVRAAASICARNAPALFVPCHRVLRTDGTLGGFAWGVPVKRGLLAREAAA
ncbi:methylated-DNA--[protein]-cysteine S-methyltransferase [Microbacterium sp. ZW T5_45]|uniref:methylated-DNA--[protein]-cysteine S-methyltransferase n=1 Tax=Microbacterium sp. ZW T5_45 TaxID=3378080 RepID=UPI0038546744